MDDPNAHLNDQNMDAFNTFRKLISEKRKHSHAEQLLFAEALLLYAGNEVFHLQGEEHLKNSLENVELCVVMGNQSLAVQGSC